MGTFPIWHDDYLFTKGRIVLTEEQLHIPGIRVFGHHALYNAIPSLNWHCHDNAFEFSMPGQGTFTFSTLEKDYPFSGGEVFLSHPDEVHGTNQVPVTTGELYWFQLDISDENHFLFLNPEAARELILKLYSIPRHVIRTEIKKTLPIIETAFKLALGGTEIQMTSSLLQLFLQLIVMYSKKELSQISPDIKTVLEFIDNNITSDLSLDSLAALANLSCSQFKQKFKKQLGIAPRHFINQQKIEYAKTLLMEGKTVTETAMLLNFTTSSYFSTVFKKYTLYTPNEYQKKQPEKSRVGNPPPQHFNIS
ncbi:hypothetical protein GCM10008910_48360 [Faecalicatena orotica]|uniref:AraC-like DNA-binding protein n=1 Tax=Faecalicatena orotica TaxID=1544 RepID=A0A2Y9BM99_9FIRM|nr:AraC family transcriptional regulator [Faecalicatena orotica]PWJ19053.1 AraC-like DNA-binding protein [Faecalicatena orotica]SSA58696.1 AraC-type DNA-binding protein [Faecalicatena orotica]